MKKKITLSLAMTLIGLTLIVIVIVALNFRDYGIESAKDKSKIVSELVRDGLTVHMINGIMDERDFFMRKIANSRNIEELWVVRSQSVIEQFGMGLDGEGPKDDIDNRVIASGKAENIVTETGESVHLRVTIPYIANYLDNPNCLQCHNAKEGEVLGAVSMIFDISEVRKSGMLTILRILVVAMVILAVVIVLANHFINRYLELFESLTESIKKGQEGDFTQRVETTLKDEGGDVARWLNSLYDRLNETIKYVDKKITILIGGTHAESGNPLIRTREIVDELVDIYKFKKTIEFDRNKEEIYDRIVSIVRSRVGTNNFAIFEINHVSKTRTMVYSTTIDTWFCDLKQDQGCEHCRALRTESNVYSDDFVNLCSHFTKPGELEHVCLPYRVTAQISLLITITAEGREEIERVKGEISTFNNYLEAAKPVLESRYLMAILKESSLRDGLTGLYNRKFLDEFIDQIARQAVRAKTPYALLMLDIDYFKMVNDTYGHDVGDVIIKGLSDTLRESIRESDLAVRFGGEEFLVMLYNANEEGAMKVAEKIRERFGKRAFSAAGETIRKTVSIGVSIYPEDADGMWKVIKYADIALYRAKNGGRNKVMRFTAEMQPKGEEY
ncbi:MAG: diguanylate cyclase [Campylobacterales bacterium]